MMKKRRHVFILVVSLILLLAAGCGQSDENADTTGDNMFNPGTYEGVSTGHGGEIKAIVTVSSDTIEKIEVEADDETDGIIDGAIEQLTEEIMSTQSLAVDVVSGATSSSEAIIEAITAALEEAGGDIDILTDPANKATSEVEEQEDITVDVAVIGSGGAGLSAAIEAKETGKSVVILETMPIVGGNTNRATGGMNAADTKYQDDDVEDTKEIWYDDTMKGGHEINDPDLLQTLVDNATDALYWLNDMGAGLTRVSLSGGQTNPRIHQPEDGSPVGPVVVDVLSEKVEELGIDILLNTTAEKLITEDDSVVGVKAVNKNDDTFTVNAKAVILATGGFGANSEMVEEYRPDLVGFSTTNHEGAYGSGIHMAEEIGADLMQIDQIQIHPTTDPETGFMFTEGLRGDGAILVNKEGKRFTNELETRDVVSQNILDQTDNMAYLIVNQEMADDNASLADYIEKGYASKADDTISLGEEIDVDGSALEETLETYGAYFENENDEEFDRDHLTRKLDAGPYYAIPVTPAIHHTMGGLKIDTETHVLNTDGDVITGLYAAGEVVGGLHGGNRIGGNAISDIVTFGRIAGQTAAADME